ncbi:hypothetical protein BGX26_005788, partial [Mortierella sp. AD094]
MSATASISVPGGFTKVRPSTLENACSASGAANPATSLAAMSNTSSLVRVKLLTTTRYSKFKLDLQGWRLDMKRW